LSSPAIQAAVQQLRSNGTSTIVESRSNELQLAERFFRQALTLAPDNADARVRLGHTLDELGRHEEAAAELRTAIEADRDRERLYLAQLFLGRAEQALGRRDEARRRYEQAAGLYPSAQSPRLALGQLARESGDRTGALHAMQNVMARRSADIDVTDPWWFYYYPHLRDAAELMQEMRTIGSVEAR
jgi:tetratricopeptide (TPR) repeat protein